MNNKYLIMIVDDNYKNLQVIGNALRENDYEIVIASTGEQAIKNLSIVTPDLILLDVMMPDMDGFDVCEEIRKNKDFINVPIIFLTAKTETENIIKGFEIGGQDYITKPFNNAELIARIKNHLKTVHYQRKLQESNRELEQFSSMVAHDLKNPLLTVSSGIKLVKRKDGDNISNESITFLDEMINKVDNMMAMIDELLSYSRLDEKEIKFSLNNVGKIVENVLYSLQDTINKKNAIIKYNKLPKIICNDTMITLLFQNLLENSMKYCDDIPKINISYIESKNNWTFILSDNGIGIPEKDRNKVFTIFSRLHNNKNKYVGTGIGLAICKKIVDIHGGRIWIENNSKDGTIFKFNIPKSL